MVHQLDVQIRPVFADWVTFCPIKLVSGLDWVAEKQATMARPLFNEWHYWFHYKHKCWALYQYFSKPQYEVNSSYIIENTGILLITFFCGLEVAMKP